jgi:uncharacterized protein YdhG (YjbR/CyaY superfamily)
MPAAPSTVEEYLAALPKDRREALDAIRKVIRKNLPKGYEEGIQYGMIGYFVPHSLYPAGYHCDPKQPLPFVHLASQKNHMAIYLFCLYMDEEAMERFTTAWQQTGKKLDMGKSCVRFKKLDQVALDVVADAIRAIPVKDFVAHYDASRPKKK